MKKWKLLALPLASFALWSCAPDSVELYNNGQTDEELVSLLNSREYGKVIWLVESRTGREPEGAQAYLLGQAYLGRAGIEPLALAAQVAAPLPDSPVAQAMFPQCSPGPLNLREKIDMKCLLKRVYLVSPPADNPDLLRARYLLRKSYPDPALTPPWVNTMIGLVEMITLVKRAGDLYLYTRKMSPDGDKVSFSVFDIPWLQTEGRYAIDDARQALARANFSGEKISQLLSGSRANEWFARVEGGIVFAETVGMARFLDFVRENVLKPSDEIKYGEMLDKLRIAFEFIDAAAPPPAPAAGGAGAGGGSGMAPKPSPRPDPRGP